MSLAGAAGDAPSPASSGDIDVIFVYEGGSLETKVHLPKGAPLSPPVRSSGVDGNMSKWRENSEAMREHIAHFGVGPVDLDLRGLSALFRLSLTRFGRFDGRYGRDVEGDGSGHIQPV